MDAITLTFGDCMENHVGMQKVGEMSENGFDKIQLKEIKKKFEDLGAKTNLYLLNKLLKEETEKAYLLIIKNGVNFLTDDKELSKKIYNEHCNLTYDKQYFDTRRNKVLNKIARWNLCFDNESQSPDYINKKGTIISYNDVPYTQTLKNKIKEMLSDKSDLKLEANYYYDINKTGIGYHGDSERKKVIGVRLGKDNNLSFKWFKNSEEISGRFNLILNDGDIYVMSEKAVGNDWKKKSLITLRHAAGCEKYSS